MRTAVKTECGAHAKTQLASRHSAQLKFGSKCALRIQERHRVAVSCTGNRIIKTNRKSTGETESDREREREGEGQGNCIFRMRNKRDNGFPPSSRRFNSISNVFFPDD